MLNGYLNTRPSPGTVELREGSFIAPISKQLRAVRRGPGLGQPGHGPAAAGVRGGGGLGRRPVLGLGRVPLRGQRAGAAHLRAVHQHDQVISCQHVIMSTCLTISC